MPGEVGWTFFQTPYLCSHCSQTSSAELLVCVRNLSLAACSDLRVFLAAAEPPCQRHVIASRGGVAAAFQGALGGFFGADPTQRAGSQHLVEASQTLTGLCVLAGDPPTPKVVAPPTEEALQQLSEARGTGSSGHPPRSEVAHSSSSVAAQLSHSSSTLTNGSSIYTASMSSTDTVLPRMSGPATAQSGSLRKRPAAETASSVVSTHRHPCPIAVKAESAPPALSWTRLPPRKPCSNTQQQAKGFSTGRLAQQLRWPSVVPSPR